MSIHSSVNLYPWSNDNETSARSQENSFLIRTLNAYMGDHNSSKMSVLRVAVVRNDGRCRRMSPHCSSPSDIYHGEAFQFYESLPVTYRVRTNFSPPEALSFTSVVHQTM